MILERVALTGKTQKPDRKIEHQDEFIFERVAVAYSRDYNEVGRVQIKSGGSLRNNNNNYGEYLILSTG